MRLAEAEQVLVVNGAGQSVAPALRLDHGE